MRWMMLLVQQIMNSVTPCVSAPNVLLLKRFGFASVGGGRAGIFFCLPLGEFSAS